MNRPAPLASLGHSRATRWIHAGLSVAVVVELLSGILMQVPQGDHPANVFYKLHAADNVTTLALAAGFWGILGTRHSGGALLGLITAMGLSGLLCEFGGETRMAIWHGLLCDLTGVVLLCHVLMVLLRNVGIDGAISEMWSLGRNAAGERHNRD